MEIHLLFRSYGKKFNEKQIILHEIVVNQEKKL